MVGSVTAVDGVCSSVDCHSCPVKGKESRKGGRQRGKGRKTRDMNKIVHDWMPEEAWNVPEGM